MTAKERQQLQEADFRAMLSTPTGRRLFVRMLEQFGLYSVSYAESATATAYNEGRRSCALALLTEAKAVAPDAYLVAMKEHFGAEQVAAADARAAAKAAAAE